MSLIKQDIIEKIREAVIIEDVIRDFLPDLTKKGANYQACCPIHKEKSPSFSVSPEKGIFKCFGCGESGDAISYLMKAESMTYPDAIQYLADKYNVDVEYEKKENYNKQKLEDNEVMKNIINQVNEKYYKQFSKLPEDSDVIKEWKGKRLLSDDDIITWKIGYAPDQFDFVTRDLLEHGHQVLGVEVGVLAEDKLKGRTWDFFRNRIIFPIHNRAGVLIGFGGRTMSKEKKEPKFINSKDSAIYNKSFALYGLHLAIKKIKEEKKAYLVEGYMDVIMSHRIGLENTVAACGTSITAGHIKEIHRTGCRHIILMTDGDDAGLKSALKNMDAFLKAGFKAEVCELPKSEDPDSFFRKHLKKPEEAHEYIAKNTMDAVIYKAEHLAEKATDPDSRSIACKEIAQTLYNIPDKIKREAYVAIVAKLLGVQGKNLKSLVTDIQSTEDLKKRSEAVKTLDDSGIKLPEGIDPIAFDRDRFYEKDGAYHFMTMKGGFFKGTNFTITPLFHIVSNMGESKRLIEIRNHKGAHIIDMQSSHFINFNEFRKVIYNKENYRFMPEATTLHFEFLMCKISDNFNLAFELKTLGWHKDGFYAFSNGVIKDGYFHPVDEFGMTYHKYETIDEDEGVSVERENRYFSPAFSSIYADAGEDEDMYENDRTFVYKKSPIDFATWTKQMMLCYGYRGRIAIAVTVMACFRDIVIKYLKTPLLFLHGEKGSGKSAMAESINSFFYTGSEAFNLHSGTHVAFFRRLARVKNAVNYCEEFHDGIDERLFQGLKGAYDGVGREIGVMSKDKRTETSKVHSVVVVAGQYLSTRDDNSLTTRSILLHFMNEGKRTNEEAGNYEKLSKWEEKGLSSLIVDVVKHRQIIETGIGKTIIDIRDQLKKELAGKEYQERMLNNFLTILAPVKLLQEKLSLGFKYEELYKQCREMIVESSDLVSDSEGVMKFWRTVEYLLDQQRIKLEEDFIIQMPAEFSYYVSKNEEAVFKNRSQNQILFIRFNKVHSDYMKAHREIHNTVGIDENTLRGYFKAKKSFIGLVKAKRFENTSSSCYAFNYDMLMDQGVNLERLSKPVNPYSNPQPSEKGTEEPETQMSITDADQLDF